MNKWSILILFFFVGFTANGQEEWTLQWCINYAWENNLSIKQGELNVDFAEIDKAQSLHNRYPSLSANSSLNSNFGRTIDPVTNEFITENFVSNNISLSSGIVVFNGFRISNAIKQARVDEASAKYDVEQLKRDVALTVANNYLGVLFAEENLNIAQSQKESITEQRDQIQKLINAGVRPANDVLDLEAQLANNEQSIITAENNRQIALLNLKQSMQLDPEVEMQLIRPGDVKLNYDPDELTFNQVYAKSLSTQPQILSNEMRVESAVLGKKMAQAGLLPSISAGASLGTNYSNKGRFIDGFTTQIVEQDVLINNQTVTIGTEQQIPNYVDNPYFDQLNDNLSYGVGVSLQIPIYNNYSNQLNVQRSKVNIELAQIQLDQTKNQLKTTVQQALADARASKRKLAATQKALEAQQAAFDNAEKNYNAGAINSFEFRIQRNNLQQAEVNELIAKYEYLFALKVLDFYMGEKIDI